jgi:hypothetical protein
MHSHRDNSSIQRHRDHSLDSRSRNPQFLRYFVLSRTVNVVMPGYAGSRVQFFFLFRRPRAHSCVFHSEQSSVTSAPKHQRVDQQLLTMSAFSLEVMPRASSVCCNLELKTISDRLVWSISLRPLQSLPLAKRFETFISSWHNSVRQSAACSSVNLNSPSILEAPFGKGGPCQVANLSLDSSTYPGSTK